MDGRSPRETAVIEVGGHAARNGTRRHQRDVRARRRAARPDQAAEGRRAKGLIARWIIRKQPQAVDRSLRP